MSYEQTITVRVILKNNTTIYQCNKETVNLRNKKGRNKGELGGKQTQFLMQLHQE